LSLFITEGQPKVKKPDIYIHLKKSIEEEKMYWEEPKYKKKINDNAEERDNKKIEVFNKKD
jgi:hypothetical protein